jgi:hypothetical protein
LFVNQYDDLLNIFDKEMKACRKWNTNEIEEAFRAMPPIDADGIIRGYSMTSLKSSKRHLAVNQISFSYEAQNSEQFKLESNERIIGVVFKKHP